MLRWRYATTTESGATTDVIDRAKDRTTLSLQSNARLGQSGLRALTARFSAGTR